MFSWSFTNLMMLSGIFIFVYKIINYFKIENIARKETQETVEEKNFREKNETNFLVALGSFASHSQIGKYTKEYFLKETNEKIFSKNGIQILSSNIKIVKGNEVEYSTSSNFLWKSTCNYFSNRANFNYGIEIQSNKNDEKSISNHLIYPLNYSIGIDEDVENIVKEFSLLPKNEDIVLFGISRGTSSIVLSLSELVKEKHFSNVKGIILEGCIDSFYNLYHQILNFDSFIQIIQKITGYDQKKNEPLKKLCKIIDDGFKIPPLLVISSKSDKEVPFDCSKNFVNQLNEKGLNIEFVELENSNHPRYMFDNVDDREKYFKAVHSFYERIDLPFLQHD